MRGVRGVVVAPCPLLALEKEGPGSRGLLVGVGALGVGGFGHLLLLAHISQSVLGVVSTEWGGGGGAGALANPSQHPHQKLLPQEKYAIEVAQNWRPVYLHKLVFSLWPTHPHTHIRTFFLRENMNLYQHMHSYYPISPAAGIEPTNLRVWSLANQSPSRLLGRPSASPSRPFHGTSPPLQRRFGAACGTPSTEIQSTPMRIGSDPRRWVLQSPDRPKKRVGLAAGSGGGGGQACATVLIHWGGGGVKGAVGLPAGTSSLTQAC